MMLNKPIHINIYKIYIKGETKNHNFLKGTAKFFAHDMINIIK